jgi:hypothetical protein
MHTIMWDFNGLAWCKDSKGAGLRYIFDLREHELAIRSSCKERQTFIPMKAGEDPLW